MPNENDIRFENSLAEAMLHFASENLKVQTTLLKNAEVMRKTVLAPLKKELDEFVSTNNRDTSEFVRRLAAKPNLLNTLRYLTGEHSKESLQRRGFYREIEPEIIRNDIDKIVALLNHLEENLTQKEIHTLEQVERCAKSITELCFCFVEHFKPETFLVGIEKEKYLRIKGTIMPSCDETLARIPDPDKKLTLTTGIGRVERRDVISANEAKTQGTFGSGKAFFSGVNLAKNIQNKIDQFDKLVKTLMAMDLLKIDESGTEYVINKQENEDLPKEPQNLLTQFKDLMDSLKVKEIPEQRTTNILHTSKTFIESLSQNSGLPLVASSSATEARALISLYHLGAFTRDEGEHKSEQTPQPESFDAFDYDAALITSNVLGSMFIYGAHHSFLEVVEPFNRLLDAAGIEAVNSNVDASLFQSKQIPVLFDASSSDNDMTPLMQRLEFIHPEFKDHVKEKALEQLSEQQQASMSPR